MRARRRQTVVLASPAPYIGYVPLSARHDALSAGDALATLLLSASLFLLVGPFLVAWGLAGMVVTQLLAFAGPALLVASTRSGGARALGLVRSSHLALLGTILIGLSLWYWNLHLVAPIGEGWSSSQEQSNWQDFVAPESRPPWATLLLFAVVPALCEELLHRGVLAPSLARYLGLWPAVLVSALFFGLSHFSLGRLLPTAVLGAGAAYVRLRSGSLLPAVLLHFLYNASLLLAAESSWSLPSALIVPSLVTTGIGVVLVHNYAKSGHSNKSKRKHTIVKN